MTNPRVEGDNRATVRFEAELWELVQGEAAKAGVSLARYVHDAAVARAFRAGSERRESASKPMTDPERKEGGPRSAGGTQAPRRPRHRKVRRAARVSHVEDGYRPRAVFSISPEWTEIRALTRDPESSTAHLPSCEWLHEYVVLDDRATLSELIKRAIRTKGVLQTEYRVRVRGVIRWAYLRAVPLLDASSAIREWLAVATDITDP